MVLSPTRQKKMCRCYDTLNFGYPLIQADESYYGQTITFENDEPTKQKKDLLEKYQMLIMKLSLEELKSTLEKIKDIEKITKDTDFLHRRKFTNWGFKGRYLNKKVKTGVK